MIKKNMIMSLIMTMFIIGSFWRLKLDLNGMVKLIFMFLYSFGLLVYVWICYCTFGVLIDRPTKKLKIILKSA